MGNSAANTKTAPDPADGPHDDWARPRRLETAGPVSMSAFTAASCDGAAGGQGGLAARRAAQGKMNQIQVNVEKAGTRRSVIGQLHSSQAQTRKIDKTDDLSKLYALGSEVMPSVHPGMEIRNAMCLADASQVVIKVRHKADSFGNKQEETEWRQSAEFMLNLPRSGQIAEVYGVWEDRDSYYVVMEKIGGSDLFELLDAEGLLPINETKAILRQLLKGVAALHEEGCIHKDLKLENVMVHRNKINAEEPVVKLIDFDTAQNWEPDSPKSKTVLGTDQYISSEAYAGKYSPASDIFAVGVIAYKLLTGRFPFDSRMFDDEAGENWVGSPKMRQIQDRVQRFNINWNCFPFKTHPEAYELMRVMLAPLETDRPEASEALKHPFLADCISPTSASGRQKLSDCVSPTSSSSRQRPTSSGVGSSAGSPKQPK